MLGWSVYVCVDARDIKVNCFKQLFGECMAFFMGKKKKNLLSQVIPYQEGLFSSMQHAGTKGSEFGCLLNPAGRGHYYQIMGQLSLLTAIQKLWKNKKYVKF